MCFFFFFKQKTAYEMRISDWSSDVCSSGLVPLSISAVGGNMAKKEQLTQIGDFAQKIANFNPRTANPRTSALSIRGAGGLSGSGDGSEGGVGVIVDDVFYTHIGFAWGPLYDLAGIEVARGPQGTLLGKNTKIGSAHV